MKRTPKAWSSTSAKTLLDAGRSDPPLRYDVEQGLDRHRQWVQSGAPLPSWADATLVLVPKAIVTSVLLKVVLLGSLSGALVVGVWAAQQPPLRPATEHPGSAPPAQLAPDAVWAAQQPPSPAAKRADAASPAQLAAAAEADSHLSADSALTPAPVPTPRARAQRPPGRTRSAPAPAFSAREIEPQLNTQPTPSAEVAPEGSEARARMSESMPAPAATPSHPTIDANPQVRAEISEGSRHAQPSPKPRQSPVASDLEEMRELATAERLLANDPARALRVVDQSDARFPNGYFRQERVYIAILALIELGRMEQARTASERFFARYPATPYAARIRRALGAPQPTAAPKP